MAASIQPMASASAFAGISPTVLAGTIGAGGIGKLAPTASAKARETAEGFEQLYLSSMLSQMFEGLHGEGPLGDAGPGGAVWRSFLTDQYAKEITRSGGVGIADQVMRELVKMQESIK